MQLQCVVYYVFQRLIMKNMVRNMKIVRIIMTMEIVMIKIIKVVLMQLIFALTTMQKL